MNLNKIALKSRILAVLRPLLYLYWELKRRISGDVFLAEFDVTDKCNLRCNHCYHFNNKNSFETQKRDLSEWVSRIDDLYEKGVRVVVIVGGEPALRKDILEYAANRFFYVDVITNGTLALPSFANLRPIVSVDGLEKTNDDIRGKGVFKKAMNNPFHHALINFTVTAENVEEMESVLKLSKSSGFKGMCCNIYTPALKDQSKDGLMIQTDSRQKIIYKLRELKKKYPFYLKLSHRAINWYESPYQDGFCYWESQAFHYDVAWKPRK